MLLTITYTGENTTDLGFLLFKNPSRPQVFELNYGRAYVFYPKISNECTTAALLLDINPIDLTRGKEGSSSSGIFEYVNDRPYVSSSFMSVAISKVFGTAMTGRADAYQVLSDSPLDLSATITMLPCRGEQNKLSSVFEPLGYDVSYESQGKYVNLTISGKIRLRDLLKHIYVLIPVFDRHKHYWVGSDEVEKLLRIGEDWLPNHPEKTYITGRYLSRRKSLVNLAFEQLSESETDTAPEPKTKTGQNLNEKRLETVVNILKNTGAKKILDLGCGEGRLLKQLLKNKQFTQITGMDVSHTALKRANERLKLEWASESLQERVTLIQGSLTYKDARIANYDAACVIEVIEHLDIPRLTAFERVLFEFAKPPIIILTTPNREYNANYEKLPQGEVRHSDHRFEWTRAEFCSWAEENAKKFGYTVEISDIGDAAENHGAPTQMGVFRICE